MTTTPDVGLPPAPASCPQKGDRYRLTVDVLVKQADGITTEFTWVDTPGDPDSTARCVAFTEGFLANTWLISREGVAPWEPQLGDIVRSCSDMRVREVAAVSGRAVTTDDGVWFNASALTLVARKGEVYQRVRAGTSLDLPKRCGTMHSKPRDDSRMASFNP